MSNLLAYHYLQGYPGVPLAPKQHDHRSVQKQPCLRVLYHPLQPLLQILPGHGAAAHNRPFVCLNGVEPESLRAVSIIGLATRPNINVSTHLPDLVLAHGAGNIALVLEH
jgi:hypothetical protein